MAQVDQLMDSYQARLMWIASHRNPNNTYINMYYIYINMYYTYINMHYTHINMYYTHMHINMNICMHVQTKAHALLRGLIVMGFSPKPSAKDRRYRRVPKFWTYGSVCCACAHVTKNKNIFSMGPKLKYPAASPP